VLKIQRSMAVKFSSCWGTRSVGQFPCHIVCVPNFFGHGMIPLMHNNSWFTASLVTWTHSGRTEECFQGVCWFWSRNFSFVFSKLFHIYILLILLEIMKQHKYEIYKNIYCFTSVALHFNWRYTNDILVQCPLNKLKNYNVLVWCLKVYVWKL
jgi:hypothetical protein